MIKRAELETLYWGATRLPPDWRSVDEIGKALGLEPEYVVRALNGYGIQVRTPNIDAHRFIWNVLERGFRMVIGKHFLYQTELNRAPVDFYIINESVGIIVDSTLPVYEIKTLHIGNSMIVKIGCSSPDENADGLERQLRDIGVKTKYIRETEEDNGDW